MDGTITETSTIQSFTPIETATTTTATDSFIRDAVDLTLERLGVNVYEAQYNVLTEPSRKILMAGGERAGKSFTAALYGVSRISFGTLYWLVGPDYEQATAEFDYMVDMLGQLGAIDGKGSVSRPRIGKCSVRLKTGQYIETKSAQEIMKLASKAPDGVIMCEAAQHDYQSYLKCVGRVAEKRGWLLLTGTFEGSVGWYPDLFNEWNEPGEYKEGVAYSLPSWDNIFVYPEGYNDPEIQDLKRIYSRVPVFFEERCAAIPVPPVGLVFREFRRLVHISAKAVYDPTLPVLLAIDPSAGGAPYSVLACQFREDRKALEAGHPDAIDYCYVIDEVYEKGMVGEQIIELTKARPWFKSVIGGAIDVEAPDELKRWRRFAGVQLWSDKINQIEGIRRLKSFLYYERNADGDLVEPHLCIAPEVKSLPHEFNKYKRKNTKDLDDVPKEVPPSQQPNHSIKALWYLLISRYGYIKSRKLAKPKRSWAPRQ